MPLLRGMSTRVFPKDMLAEPEIAGLASNFELVLTYLAEDNPWLSEAANLTNRARFLTASRSLARVILAAQADALGDPMPPWIEALIKEWHEKQVTVITFNYDTLVEKAYTEIISGADHQEIYGIPVPDIRSRVSSLYGGEPRETFRYLKLHGSVNWCYSGAPSFFGETIYDLHIAGGWGRESAEPEDDLERKAPEKVHLVVPPTTTKSALFNNEIVRSQWRLARSIVEKATTIYCLGYSLPETDQMVRYLLGTVPTGKVFVPIDTSALVGSRYARLLRPHQVTGDYVGKTEPIPEFVGDWTSGRVKRTLHVRSRGGTPRRKR
jgi:hypothetical protein